MDFRIIFACFLWVVLMLLAVYASSVTGTEEKGAKNWWRTWALFMVVLGLSIPVWRWRSIVYNGEINVDESQILAQALRYTLDPLPWRSVDGGSAGPLYTWALFWGPLFGLKFTYLTARITGIACYWLMCAGMSLAFSRMVGRRLALLFTMPVVTLSLTAINFDYVFFSSEQLPMAIMAWVCYLLVSQVPVPTVSRSYLVGLLTGALPFCKIQVGPVGVVLWGIGAAILVYFRKNTPNQRAVFSALILGGITFPLLILGPVYLQGSWSDFVILYLQHGLGYGASVHPVDWTPSSHLWSLISGVNELRAFCTGLLILGGAYACFIFVRRKSSLLEPAFGLAAAVIFSLTVAFCVIRPGFLFPHYTLLLLVPLGLLAAVPCLFIPFENLHLKNVPPFLLYAVASLSTVPQLLQTWDGYAKQPALLGDWGNGIHPIGDLLKKLTKPGDTILVWGYAPKFYVFSGLPPSYRVVTTIPLLAESNLAASSPVLERYLADLDKYPPALIVDAPDEFWFPDPVAPRGQAGRHFMHPPTSRLISKNYELIGQIPYPAGPPNAPQRLPIYIYKRKA